MLGPFRFHRPGRAVIPTLAAALLFAACASQMKHAGYGNPDVTRSPAIRFQFIYVVHGDGNYAYFDDAGYRHLADTEAVAQARDVALGAPDAEVFVFHQKPASFRLFHEWDGVMLQYRGGCLVRRMRYDRAPGENDMRSEAALFSRYAAAPPGAARFFAYFGHEIPVTRGIPYSESRTDTALTLASFARGVRRFAGPAASGGKPFALIALSACHGGTPAATMALAPLATYLLASPGELHLAYLDTRPFARLSQDPAAFDSAQAERWARAVVMASFSRQIAATQTSVTLSLYDTQKAVAYLERRRDAWDMDVFAPSVGQPKLYRDCGELTAFGEAGAQAGIVLYYRAARFGPERWKAAHSGWDCPADEEQPSEPADEVLNEGMTSTP